METQQITKDNFHLKTKATFEFVKYGSQAFDLFEDLKKDHGVFFSSNSGSKYIVIEDEVYRLSDHWGNVASCTWYLSGSPSMPTWKTNWIFAKCNLDDFQDMKKPIEYIEFEGVNLKSKRTGKWTFPINLWIDETIEKFQILTEPKKVIYYE